jgi:hypothetical protein
MTTGERRRMLFKAESLSMCASVRRERPPGDKPKAVYAALSGGGGRPLASAPTTGGVSGVRNRLGGVAGRLIAAGSPEGRHRREGGGFGRLFGAPAIVHCVLALTPGPKALRMTAGRRQARSSNTPAAAAARPAVCRVRGAGRVLTRSLGPSSIPSLCDGVMLGRAWIDRPVDTRGCTPASTSLPCSMEVQPCPCHLRPVIRLRH